jgi:hypothetical protein
MSGKEIISEPPSFFGADNGRGAFWRRNLPNDGDILPRRHEEHEEDRARAKFFVASWFDV